MKILIIMCLLSSISFSSETRTFVSGKFKNNLIELFSSEGCSSCPPAEKKLYALRLNTDLWKTFIPINFHVDYWNQLGWIDKFSTKKFTTYQNEYASKWGVARIYTPEFVLNSKEAGTNIPKFTMSKSSGDLKIIFQTDKKIEIEFNPISNNKNKLTAYFSILGNNLESKVTSGENKGEVLKHHFVALNLEQKNMDYDSKNKKYSTTFEWPVLKDYTKNRSIVAWIIDTETNQYVQAAGGDI